MTNHAEILKQLLAMVLTQQGYPILEEGFLSVEARSKRKGSAKEQLTHLSSHIQKKITLKD